MIKQRFHIRQKKKEKKCITKAIFQIKPFYSDLGMRIVKVEGFELDLTFFFFFGSIFNLNSFPLINLQLFFSAPWLESLRCFFLTMRLWGPSTTFRNAQNEVQVLRISSVLTFEHLCAFDGPTSMKLFYQFLTFIKRPKYNQNWYNSKNLHFTMWVCAMLMVRPPCNFPYWDQ